MPFDSSIFSYLLKFPCLFFSSTSDVNIISFSYLFTNTEKRKRIFQTFKTIEYFQKNLLIRVSDVKFLQKPGGGGVKTAAGSEKSQVSGNYHEQKEPIFMEIVSKSAMFLRTPCFCRAAPPIAQCERSLG